MRSRVEEQKRRRCSTNWPSSRSKSMFQQMDMARIYVGLGEKDKAFEWLEKGL